MRLFRSVKFNVLLFTVLAAASALGTFLPQRNEVPAKVEAFLAAHPSLGPVMDWAGFFDLYHSGWYIALLGLMAFDVVVCKLRSLPKEIHNEDRLSERIVSTSPLKQRLRLALPLEAAAERAKARLRTRNYHFREWREGNEVHLWAAKHRLQRWGDFVLHVSIVVILVGGLFGGLMGFEEFLPVVAGGQKSMQNRPWTVAVDDFVVKYYENSGAARTYASEVRVIDEDRVVGKKRIVVNEPLDIGGVRFYQASWGMTGMLRSATLELLRPGGEGPAVKLPWREKVPLEGTGLQVAAEMLLPDFTVDAQGRPDTRGLEPNNPAVLVSFYDLEDRRVASLWLLDKQPHLCFKVKDDETVEMAPHPPFRLKGFEPMLFSGLQVAYDPGVKLVAYGCLALLAGLAMHFYFHQRRLRFLLTGDGGGTDLQAGGWSSRHPADFEAEFQGLIASLQADGTP